MAEMIIKNRSVYENVLSIPAQRICNNGHSYAIEHVKFPAGHKFEVSSGRTTIFGGHTGKPIVYDHETQWHRLVGPEGCWIVDWPIEQWEHDQYVKDTCLNGRILIGGLGVGYITTVLAQRKRVKEIVVVEKAAEIIQLVYPHLLQNDLTSRTKVKPVNADLFDFLAKSKEQFDWAFFDIWQGDGESELFETVIPLLQLSPHSLIKNRPVCWRENIMRGQLHMSLHNRMSSTKLGIDGYSLDKLCEDSDSIWMQWSIPFFRWVRTAKPNDKRFSRVANFYAGHYGIFEWDETWDWYISTRQFNK